jgi:mannose-6-phosphate isomerase-like protein (cupin superfamily)
MIQDPIIRQSLTMGVRMYSSINQEAAASVRSLWVAGHRVTPLTCAGRVVALEVATPIGVPGPPPHYHDDCAEFFYVTAGRLGVMREGEWVSLEPGQHAEVPRGVLHTFRNEGADEVRAITGFEPAGFEAFFEEYGIDATQPGAFEASVSAEAIERFVAGCSRFGMIIPPDTTAPTN